MGLHRGVLRALLPLVLLLAHAAFAGRVVVLEIGGDRHGRLRAQIEQAVRRAHVLELVPLGTYLAAAKGHGISRARAMTPAGVRALSGPTGLTIAVGGSLGRTFFVRLFDPAGFELWSKQLPQRRGLISPQDAKRLAKAVEVAASQVTPASRGGPDESSEPAPLTSANPSTPNPSSDGALAYGPDTEQPPAGNTGPGNPAASNPVQTPSPTPEPQASSATPPSGSTAPATPATTPPAEAPAATPLAEAAPSEPALPGPHWLVVKVLGTTSFRSYCARPGVSACGEYDSLDASSRPPGGTVQFDPQVPYAGVDLGLEVFPFATLDNLARGFGLLAEYHRGFVRTNVALQGEGGSTPTSSTNSTDSGYDAELAWRYYFARGKGLVGYAGVRAGLRAYDFNVDASVAQVLPGSHRRSVVAGVDGAFPILRLLRIEGAAELLPGAHPGTDEVVSFGASGKGSGYALELGAGGDVYGPIGYFAHVRYAHFSDRFSGQGTLWPDGGAAQESYVTVLLGATFSF